MSERPTAEPCLAAREWLSAHRDGEAFDDPGARAHVAACTACTAWSARLDAVTPRLRVRPAGEAPDVVSPAVAAWWAREDSVPSRQAQAGRVLLGLAGIAAIVLAALGAIGVGGTLGAAGQHVGWELHAFEAALGVGFCFAAVRPDRYGRSLLPVTAAVALLTLHPFVTGLSNGTADPLTEASHLPTLMGLAALLLLADAGRRRGAGHDSTRRHAHA